MSTIKKLLKALSGTISWNLQRPKAINKIIESNGTKEKQKNGRPDDQEHNLAES